MIAIAQQVRERPGTTIVRYFFSVFVYDDGHVKSGAPKGGSGVWRQVGSSFGPQLPGPLVRAAQNYTKFYGTQAKIVKVDFDARSVETILVLEECDGGDDAI